MFSMRYTVININRRVFLMSYLSLYVFILTSHKSMVKFNNHLKLPCYLHSFPPKYGLHLLVSPMCGPI